MTEVYIAAEPEEATAYRDDEGGLHPTREAALQANFDLDLRDAINRIPRAGPDFEQSLRDLAMEYPDFLRILVGDRDFT